MVSDLHWPDYSGKFVWRKVPFTEKALRVKAKRGETTNQLKEETLWSEEVREAMFTLFGINWIFIKKHVDHMKQPTV